MAHYSYAHNNSCNIHTIWYIRGVKRTMVIQLCKFIFIFTHFDIKSAVRKMQSSRNGLEREKNTFDLCVCLRANVNKLQIHYIFPYLHMLGTVSWKKNATRTESSVSKCIFFPHIHTQRAMCIKISYHLSKFSSPLILSPFGTFWLFCWWFLSQHENVCAVSENARMEWNEEGQWVKKIRQIFIWPSGNGHFPEKLSSISTHEFFSNTFIFVLGLILALISQWTLGACVFMDVFRWENCLLVSRIYCIICLPWFVQCA